MALCSPCGRWKRCPWFLCRPSPTLRGAYWSINRDDRYQGEITDNFSLHDQRIYLRAVGSLRILGGPLRGALAIDQINRASQLPGSSYTGVERRVSLSAQAVF